MAGAVLIEVARRIRNHRLHDALSVVPIAKLPTREAVVAVVQVGETNRYVGRHGHIAPVDNWYRQYEGALAGQQVRLSDLTSNVVAGLGASSVGHLSANQFPPWSKLSIPRMAPRSAPRRPCRSPAIDRVLHCVEPSAGRSCWVNRNTSATAAGDPVAWMAPHEPTFPYPAQDSVQTKNRRTRVAARGYQLGSGRERPTSPSLPRLIGDAGIAFAASSSSRELHQEVRGREHVLVSKRERDAGWGRLTIVRTIQIDLPTRRLPRQSGVRPSTDRSRSSRAEQLSPRRGVVTQ